MRQPAYSGQFKRDVKQSQKRVDLLHFQKLLTHILRGLDLQILRLILQPPMHLLVGQRRVFVQQDEGICDQREWPARHAMAWRVAAQYLSNGFFKKFVLICEHWSSDDDDIATTSGH